MPTFEEVVYDGQLIVPERAARVISLLSAESDHGLAMGLDLLLSTDDERLAHYVAGHLGTLPGAQEAKTRAVERLAESGVLVGSASWLVPWMPEALAGRLVPRPPPVGVSRVRGTDYYAVGTRLKNGLPEARERVKLADEIRALGWMTLSHSSTR